MVSWRNSVPWDVVEAKGIKDFRQELREADSGRSMVIMEVPPRSATAQEIPGYSRYGRLGR